MAPPLKSLMDGKCLIEPDSKFRFQKCTTIPHDKVDRISQLPNEIILVILSFLSMREAAATSILSRRWSYLWKHTSNLNFKKKSLNLRPRIETNREGKYWDAKECRYIALVNSVLQSHEALSLKKFKVSFYVNRSAHNIVSKWLEFVFSRQVETLKLDFRCMVTIHKVVLEEILRGSIISPIFFKSLKSLCLKSFKVSGEDIKLFLRNCPLLERLIIHHTLLMSDVEVCGANLRLNHLDLSNCSYKGSIIKISAPNLTWLGLDDRVAGKLLLDRKFSKLVGASLVLGILRPDVVQNFTSTISRFVFQLKTLRLILLRPEVFLANRFPELPNLSKLVIEYYGDYKQHSILNGTALIWACPRLQEFTFKFINIIEKPNVGAEAMANVECSPHQHIRVFEFIGFSAGVEGHMELVTYMVNKCAALQKIIIGHEPYLPDRSKSADERLASGVYAKQKLQGKVPNHIQLQFYNYRC